MVRTPELTGHIDRAFRFNFGKNHYLFAEGWLLDKKQRIKSLSLTTLSGQLRRIPRKDVADKIPEVSYAKESGFLALIKNPIMNAALPISFTFEEGGKHESNIPIEALEVSPIEDIIQKIFYGYSSQAGAEATCEMLFKELLESGDLNLFSFKKNIAPEISVIIPVHNKAYFTAICLWALSMQRVDIEVIVANNGSTDETSKLLDSISDISHIKHSSNLHFIAACNDAVKIAKGKFLLFLNNDCFLFRRTLQDALSTLKRNSEIGVVGSLLLSPTAFVLEYGSRVLRDGSTAGIGRGLRREEVFGEIEGDYVSGAFLLTHKELFEEVGGFDPIFAPAYGEDADYCLSLKEKGFKTVVSSVAQAIHIEHGSSSSKEEVKEQIEKSKKILLKKHAFLIDPPIERRNKKKKQLLIIDDLVPIASVGQGYPRSSLIIDELTSLGFDLTVVGVNEFDSLENKESAQFSIVKNVTRALLPSFLEKHGNNFDGWFISRPQNIEILSNIKRNPSIPIIYDAEAIFSLREITKKERIEKRPLTASERNLAYNAELSPAKIADLVLTPSRSEEEILKSIDLNTSLLSYGVKLRPSFSGLEGRQDILTVSPIVSGDTPNFDGTQWFIHEVFPKISSKLTLNFKIAGEVKASLREHFNKPFVKLLGALPSLEYCYDSSRVFVAPIRFGAGISIKVIEAAANGIPTVITPLLCSQLGWVENEETLVGDTADEFAMQCLKLLSDNELWLKIQQNALKRIRSEYSLEIFRESLKRALSSLKLL